MPIEGLSEQRRLPRLGKVRLGIKKVSPRTEGEYPVATNYFVCTPEVQAVYGDEPKRLDVIIPVEDEEIWASQYYRQYSKSRGLICKGDGRICRRMIDKKTGAIAGRDTTAITWEVGLPCNGQECEDYQKNSCQEVMNLQFLLPKVPGLGVWQIDTGSINSIMNINSCAEMIRAMCGKVSWIPLILSLEPMEVNNPEDGKKKTVYCLFLRYEQSAEALLRDSEKPRLQLIAPPPDEDEAPEDRKLSVATEEKAEELESKVQDDVAELWPEDNTQLKLDNYDLKIDMVWLRDALKKLNHNDDTFKNWLVNPKMYPKLNIFGTLEDVLSRLNLEQQKMVAHRVELALDERNKKATANKQGS